MENLYGWFQDCGRQPDRYRKETISIIFRAQVLLTFKMSQDHIQTLFAKIRSNSGFTNNPDVIQVQPAIKSLLVKTEVAPSVRPNCLEVDADRSRVILRPKKKMASVADDVSVHEPPTVNLPDILDTESDVSEYIAGFIIRTLKLKCSNCIEDVYSEQSLPNLDHHHLQK